MQSTPRALRARLRLIVWTINDGSDLCALVGGGVDGIMTDEPGRLRSLGPALGPARPLSGSPPPHHEPRRWGLKERCPRRRAVPEDGGDAACSHVQPSLAHYPCADARARCVPSSLSHHRNGLLESSRAVDTPAPWDHPDAHGDLHLVSLILSSTSSAPCHVGSKDVTIPALPRAAGRGTVTGIPSAYAASQARLPGAWWYREATPRAPISSVRRSTPASVRHVYRWSSRPRRCMAPAARGPRRRRPCVCGALTLASRGLSHAGKGGAGGRGGVGPRGRGEESRWCPESRGALVGGGTPCVPSQIASPLHLILTTRSPCAQAEVCSDAPMVTRQPWRGRTSPGSTPGAKRTITVLPR